MDKIYIAGHRGMVGSAIVRRLQALGQTNIVTRTRRELDLLDQRAAMEFMQAEKPDQVTPSSRSPASSCVKATTASTAPITASVTG